MGLNDLMNEIKNDPASFLGEEATENKVCGDALGMRFAVDEGAPRC